MYSDKWTLRARGRGRAKSLKTDFTEGAIFAVVNAFTTLFAFMSPRTESSIALAVTPYSTDARRRGLSSSVIVTRGCATKKKVSRSRLPVRRVFCRRIEGSGVFCGFGAVRMDRGSWGFRYIRICSSRLFCDACTRIAIIFI